MGYRKQQGIVIVIALFVMALVAVMSYVMMHRLQRDTQRTTLYLRDLQATAYGQGAVAWAMDQLKNNWAQQKPKQVIDMMPAQSPKQSENGYEIISTIYDMQARFNINCVAQKEGQEMFKRLLQILIPKLSSEQQQVIIQATVQWVSQSGGQQGFSKYYAQLAFPYRAARRPMISVSEWRLVKGVTPAVYAAVSPYLVALPEQEIKVNVQTATPVVLMLLSPQLTLPAAKGIEQWRKSAPFTATDDFSKMAIVRNHGIDTKKITVVSHYFLIETQVTIENQRSVLYTLVVRTMKDRQAEVNILWQSKGIW